MRLVQLIDLQKNRRVALVREPDLVLLKGITSIYSLAVYALQQGSTLKALVESTLTDERISYDGVYNGTSTWALLPAIDNPFDHRYCMVSGTGLTHKASAENRQKMHDSSAATPLTDSMKIYQWGLEGGKPGTRQIGTQPEWFYKGNGSVLKAHNDVLTIPNYGNDGGHRFGFNPTKRGGSMVKENQERGEKYGA